MPELLPCILLVDDDKNDPAILSASTEIPGGIRIKAFDSGDNAISYLKQLLQYSEFPSFTIPDPGIPGINGKQDISFINSIEKFKNIPILIYSANLLSELKNMEKFAVTGHIAHAIAHEIKNPLTSIGLATQLLTEGVLPKEEAASYLEMIRRNTDRINQLVENLLQSTQFSELITSVQPINGLLDETLLMVKDRLELLQIKVQKKYCTEDCNVSVDKEKIAIALLNIIINSLEALEPVKGILTIETNRHNNKCQVIIADNGAGMDSDTLAKLFNPYFTSKKKGNGMGLTHTQNIILNHQGNIHVESEPGTGTRFTITLNIAG